MHRDFHINLTAWANTSSLSSHCITRSSQVLISPDDLLSVWNPTCSGSACACLLPTSSSHCDHFSVRTECRRHINQVWQFSYRYHALSNVTTHRHLAKHKDLSPDSPIDGHLDILIFGVMPRCLPSLCTMDKALVLCLLHVSLLGFRPFHHHKIWSVMGSLGSIYLWITVPHITVSSRWVEGERWLLVCPQETSTWSWNALNSKGWSRASRRCGAGNWANCSVSCGGDTLRPGPSCLVPPWSVPQTRVCRWAWGQEKLSMGPDLLIPASPRPV